MTSKRETFKIQIYCNGCRTHLLDYLKEGKGHLVKCYLENIVEYHSTTPMHCPTCNTQYAREWSIHGRRAYKIIQGKVYVKGGK